MIDEIALPSVMLALFGKLGYRMPMENIFLTESVKKGGCAAKLPAGELRQILKGILPTTKPKELLVGAETMDDAALWDLGDGRLLIQTLDFFTPIVDDPFTFGAIAAANALSDVYAMGGEPKTAMAILAFPTSTLPMSVLESVMQGAVTIINESGATLVGGHSIDDDTLKFGLSVSGFVGRDEAWTNSGVVPGDVLILTKALGTGTVTTALKRKTAEEAWVQAAQKSMTTLNVVRDLIDDIPVNAATDITGVGLAGHALQIARASGVVLNLKAGALPALPGAIELLQQNVVNRAHKTNADYVASEVNYTDVPEHLRLLTVDPQTSGGLLLSVPAHFADRCVEQLKLRFPFVAKIGFASEPIQSPSPGALVRFVF